MHFLFLGSKTLTSSSYFQPFKYVTISCMIEAVGISMHVNYPWSWNRSFGPTWILVGGYFFGQIPSADVLQTVFYKINALGRNHVQLLQFNGHVQKTLSWKECELCVRNSLSHAFQNELRPCHVTFALTSVSRVNAVDNKNSMFFRFSVDKSWLISAINTLKVNNKRA